MTARYLIPPVDLFFDIDHASVQIVFHGINKSGSLAMARVLRDSYQAQGRGSEVVGHYFLGGSTESYIELVQRCPPPCFLVGHYLYGALKPTSNRVWITQFRHPLPRILSCYTWLKNKAKAQGPDKDFPPLADWIEKTGGRDHSMISQFGAGFGTHRKELVKSLSLSNLYEISMDCLDRDVSCIGIAEYFEESIFLFASVAGLSEVVPWTRDVRNPGRPLSSDVTQSVRDLVTEIFAYDFLLYEYALNRFRRQLEKIDFGESLNEYKLKCQDQYNDRILIGNS